MEVFVYLANASGLKAVKFSMESKTSAILPAPNLAGMESWITNYSGGGLKILKF